MRTPLPSCSCLIPTTPEINALTWMLKVWQSRFATGASIDTVARWCIQAQESSLTGELSASQRNDAYLAVYQLSMELANIGLLFPPKPGAVLVYVPARPWFAVREP